MLEKSEVGKLGEQLACDFLIKRGYKILARNWRSLRWGELDIVARDKDCLVFVEVKTRSPGSLGQPFESVNYFKVKSLLRSAQNYKLQNPATPEQMRMDVVSIVLGTPPEIEYFENVYWEE